MTVDEARRYWMKRLDSDISLNFDTELEANLKFINNLLGENSIHSHNTSSIIDQRAVNFQDADYAVLDGEISDSYSEGDIVYYHKDDLTNYSWNLDLNKVHWKHYDGKFWPLSELGYLDEWRSEDS